MSGACALVTGGSRGLGRAMVQSLVGSGWRVGFTFLASAEEAASLEEGSGGRALAFRSDAREAEAARTLIPEVEERLGPVDALVNNAGVSHAALLAMSSDEEWQRVLETNLGGAFRACRAVLPGMLRRRRGSIVNVSSLGALHGVAGQALYAASKAGLLGMTRALARECGRRGVRVNALLPGFVETDMTSSLPEAARSELRSRECLPGGVEPAAVADALVFLVSDAARGITGQSLVVDAGASA